ncbi:MAG: ATP-binding protein [Acidobacteriota bacterium]|nr:ATP-binding protein [Acidobacteriota bacterium]
MLWAPGLAALLVAIVLLAALLPYLTLDRRLLATLGLAAVAAGGVVVGVLLWFRASFLRPFASLLEEAENLMIAGDSSYRVPDPPVEELAVLSRSLNRLADRVQEQIAEKEFERHRLQEILAGVPLGVLVIGPDRELLYANSTLQALFGMRFVDTKRIAEFLEAPEIQASLDEAQDVDEVRGAADVVEINHHYKERDLAVSARRIEALGGILLMVRDVTEANRVEKMRRDFVANLSHEIKTPLAVIRGAAETLEGAQDDPDAIEHFVSIIVKQIYRLEDLLKDLLTLSRLERPEASRETEVVDLVEICERARELVESVAERQQVSIEVELGDVTPFEGDPAALERLVMNLLVTGVQYNRPGGTVRLRMEESEDGITLEVEDDGYGIAEDELPRVFERFYRVDKGRGRREGGSGLGLAIVKHVTQFHGGTVEVRSYLERGSVFRVHLPGAKGQGSGQEPAAVEG